MPGLNLLERFREKHLKGTAIEYHGKYCAHELTRRHSAGGVDHLSQSLLDARAKRVLPHRSISVVLLQDWPERSRRRSESGKKGPQ